MSDIIVGSVGVRLVPNAEGFSAKAKALTQGLSADVRADLDDKDARARLDMLGRPRDAKINANADTLKADLELDYAARDRTAKIDADTSGFSSALGGLAGGLSSLTSGVSGLGAAGLVAAPALITVGAAAAGLAATLAVPVVAAGGGLTIFGFIAGKAMKDTEKVGKQIDALRKKAETLSSPAARKAALDQAKALEASLTGPQKAFLAAQTSLSKAFKALTEAAGPSLFKPLVAGMDALAGLLPKTAPLLAAVSAALTDVIRSASQSGAFDGFLNFLTKASGPAIRGFADIAGNIAKGIGGIGQAFQPLAGPLMGSLENMARSFSHIGSSKGLADFVDYVRRNGPLAASTLADLAKATAGLVRDLAPAGPDILRVVDAMARLVNEYQQSGTLRKTVTGIGAAFRGVGMAIRADWNGIIQPVLHGMVDALGHVAVAEGRMLQAMGHVPGFGWAKAAGNLLVNAGHAAEGLARDIRKIPSHASTVYGFVGQGAALSAIARIKAELAGVPRSISTSYYVNQVNSVSKAPLNFSPGHQAYGGSVPKDGGPYADRYPYLLAPGEEVISNKHGQADRHRSLLKAINAGHLAGGGTAGGRPAWTGTGWGSAYKPPPWWEKFLHFALGIAGGGGAGGFHYSVADQSAIVQVRQQIRDLTKQLNAHGKNRLEGLDRQAAELNLKLAQQQLRDAKNAPVKALRGVLAGGFNIDQALGKQPTNPIASAVHDSLAQFKQQIVDAGGVWTKHLQHLAAGMVKNAAAIDRDNRALDASTTKLGLQQQTLADLTSQMDSLTSTMSQFGSSVGGNFLSSGFGLGGQSSTFTPTVDNTPALSAATDQLNAAKAHLAALSTGEGDINTRLANAFQAQGVEANIAKLQAQVDQLSQPVTTTTDSLSSLRDILTGDTKNALAFNDALHTLAGEGLNKDLFGQLAASGDTMLATELAAAGQSAVADINSLWTQRAAAAAQVAAYATQQVYGTQQAVLQAQITRQNALIGKTQASIDSLNAQVATLGQRVENGARNGVAGLQAQIDAVAASVAAIPRQIKHARK